MAHIEIPDAAQPTVERREVDGRVHLFVRAEGVTGDTLARIGAQVHDGWADLGPVDDPTTLGRHLLIALSNLCILSGVASPEEIAPGIDPGDGAESG